MSLSVWPPAFSALYFAAKATTTLEPGVTHILLIEDDPAIGESLVDALKANGFRATWHTTGAAGLAHAHTANPHLILLDLRLPDGSGLDFCRQMRQAGLHQLVISGAAWLVLWYRGRAHLVRVQTLVQLTTQAGDPPPAQIAGAVPCGWRRSGAAWPQLNRTEPGSQLTRTACCGGACCQRRRMRLNSCCFQL